MVRQISSRVLGILIVGAMIFSSFIFTPVYAQDDTKTDIDDASNYYVKHYKSSDCVLCANAYMLMRAAYFNGSELWDEITNQAIRQYACTSKTGSAMRFSYDYKHDGVTYSVVHDYLSGSKSAKTKKLINLLKKHPEGIVVRGASRTGGHGILLTSYKNGTFYGVDSAQNKAGQNLGILKYSKTSMYSISGLTQIWYIERQSGTPYTAPKSVAITNLKAEQQDGSYKITWDTSNNDISLDGFVVRYISSSDYLDEVEWTTLKKTSLKKATIENFADGVTYYIKVKGYRKTPEGDFYTKSATVKVKMEKAKPLLLSETAQVVSESPALEVALTEASTENVVTE